MYISANPKTKREAARWVRIGIELTVMDAKTGLPIRQQDGVVEIIGPEWKGTATLKNGLVIRIQ